MTKIKLSEALQIKKDLHEEIGVQEKHIRTENCVIKGNPRSVDINATYKKWLELLQKLAQIKEIIQQANLKIYHKIYEYDMLAEKKRLFSSLRIYEGKRTIKNGKKEEMIEMEAVLTKSQVTAEIAKIDARIKELRNELTEYNNNTEVEV